MKKHKFKIGDIVKCTFVGSSMFGKIGKVVDLWRSDELQPGIEFESKGIRQGGYYEYKFEFYIKTIKQFGIVKFCEENYKCTKQSI